MPRLPAVRIAVAAVALVVAGSGPVLAAAAPAGAPGASDAWRDHVPFTNRVVSSPAPGGGFPTPTGKYVPGTCRAGR